MQSTLRPSLFDIQVNGFAGVDFQRLDLKVAKLERACHALAAAIPTGFC